MRAIDCVVIPQIDPFKFIVAVIFPAVDDLEFVNESVLLHGTVTICLNFSMQRHVVRALKDPQPVSIVEVINGALNNL